jgi:TonB family protein
VSVSPQKHPDSQAPAGQLTPAGQPRAAEKLILLTLDESLHEALANVVAHDCLTVVADESALSQHLLSDHAGVAFIDAGALHSHPGAAVQLAQRLHHQLPEVVLVVAGDSAAQNELAGLVAEGTVYRFVHKPVSAQRVKLFVEAAWRKRDGTNASGLYPTLSMPPPAPIVPEKRGVPWPMITAATVAIGAGVAWFVVRNHAHTGAAAGSQTSAPLAPQRALPVAVAPLTPAASSAAAAAAAAAGTADKAAELDRLATAAEQALLAGNLTDAARLTAAARAVDPDHVRVKFLTAQIAREQARRRPETPLAAQPLLRRAAPPATPSASAGSAPLAAGSAATTLAATVSSSPATVSAPGSSSPAGAARDANAVIAMTLQRVYSVNPQFPDFARQRDLSGYVDLEFTVLSDGSVTNVTVVKSQPARVFDKSATDAVRQWRYRPLVRNGVPTEQHARVRLNFAYQ